MEANNMAAMRKALLALKELDFNKEEDRHAFYRIIDDALAAPARNCDVGTAEGQYEQMVKYCDKQHGKVPCERCPHFTRGINCALAWAQMPYESEVEK